MIISSQQNPIYRKVRSLLTTKGVLEHGQCLLSGEKLTREFLQRDNKPDFYWIQRADQKSPPGDSANNITLARELFESIDIFGTHHPILCIDCKPIPSMEKWDSERPTLYCSLGDPSNLGAALRSCFAFGIDQVVLTQEACLPYLPKALRTSSGYSFDIQFFKGPAIREITGENIYALDMNGQSLAKTKLAKNIHFLIGEEGQGVPKSFLGPRVAIPMNPEVESLNAAVATSLFLYEWKRQQED